MLFDALAVNGERHQDPFSRFEVFLYTAFAHKALGLGVGCL